MNINFQMTTKIITGKDCVVNNSDIFASFGKKCIIVTGKSSAVKCGALSDVTKALEQNSIEYVIYDGIEQNPTFESCKKAAEIAESSSCEFVIGIGGGSPLDAAKAVAVLALSSHFGEKELFSACFDKALPIIAVGTTAGTGSEVTHVSVITDSNGNKKSFRHPLVFPKVSFGDAKYTMTLSDSFTRSTAIDALSHCVESYFNKTANDISRTFALRGCEILLKKMKAPLSKDALSFEDREEIYCASIYGGLAISVTGTAFPHAMGYFLSERKGIAHGNACGIYLEEFIAHCEAVCPDDMREFLSKLGVTKNELLSAIKNNLPEINVRIDEDELCELAPRYYGNKSLSKTPGSFDGDNAKELLIKLFM